LLLGFIGLAVLRQVAKAIKAIEDAVMKRLVLVRWRLPEEERIHVKWNVLIEKGNCKV
jgi:hypothetical protein